MSPSVSVLEDQYFLLRGSLSTLSAQGATPGQICDLKAKIVQSRTNYWTALNRTFHDDDPSVEALVSTLTTDNLTLQATIKNLGKIADILNAIDKAIEVGSDLVKKAITL